ncbi:MAG: 16S rRNA (guanine(527)-N(7))-methyltransferase RsmG [Paracoccaceae bacterium]|nr:16S rRNA (guanine(527)-N(7))-methyltransferase RsmG [Paracoccaceae bacterium]
MKHINLLPGLNVSRETFLRLKEYEKLLFKWNAKINLVSKSTLDNFWNRHVLDSAQFLSSVGEKAGNWVDLGTGGGLPGLVVAILSDEIEPVNKLFLVEADVRKAVFLKTVCRELGIKVEVYNNRIEELPVMSANIVSARALAPLKTLCLYAKNHLEKDGVAVFAKGENWKAELVEAQKKWIFSYEAVKSTLHEGSVVLVLRGIKSV